MKSTPPLLMLAEGRRPRPRRSPLSAPRELALHMAVVDLLRKLGRPDWRWSHFPSGEARDPRAGAKLNAMGLQRGWPDIVMVSPRGIFCGLELKRAGGALSDAQEAFHIWCISNGIRFAVAETIDEVLVILEAWEVISTSGGRL